MDGIDKDTICHIVNGIAMSTKSVRCKVFAKYEIRSSTDAIYDIDGPRGHTMLRDHHPYI